MKKVDFNKLQAGDLVEVPRTQFAPMRSGWNGWLFSEAVWATEGDITIAFITVPLGLTCLISKEMLIINDYYFATKERKKNHDTDFRIVRRDR